MARQHHPATRCRAAFDGGCNQLLDSRTPDMMKVIQDHQQGQRPLLHSKQQRLERSLQAILIDGRGNQRCQGWHQGSQRSRKACQKLRRVVVFRIQRQPDDLKRTWQLLPPYELGGQRAFAIPGWRRDEGQAAHASDRQPVQQRTAVDPARKQRRRLQFGRQHSQGGRCWPCFCAARPIQHVGIVQTSWEVIHADYYTRQIRRLPYVPPQKVSTKCR